MNVVVNGEPCTVATDYRVADLAADLDVGPKGVAVAVNGEVVSRSEWTEHRLDDGDRVEVLGAMQGG